MTDRPVPRGAWLAAASLTAVLAAFGGRFGFHRDELYFIEAGKHPAWGYPDQPPLVPILAAAWHGVTQGSLLAFRLVPAVLAGAIVLVSAAISARLGGSPRDQVGTAVAVAVCAVVVVTGRLFSTTTFDVLGTAVVVCLLLRALDAAPGPDTGAWLLVGLAAGVTLQVKTLLATVLLAAIIGLLAAGPRHMLRRPGPWLAALVAAAIAAPNVIWQAQHGWPQLEMSRQIAAGSSATSVERPLVVPMQLVIVGPVVGIVVVIGLVALLRSPGLRRYRWLGVAYLVLTGLVVLTGGKPYYTAALLLPLIAAGVPPVLDRMERSRRWRAGVAVLLAVHLVGTAVIALPLTSPGSPVTAFANGPNPDVGETVGWDRLASTVSGVVRTLPGDDQWGRTVVLTGNYGEAGALDRARRRGAGIPPVYSGHNAYGEWGPPPESATTVVLVGRRPAQHAAEWFGRCKTVARIDNGVGLDNEEQGAPVQVCRDRKRPWAQLWPQIRHLG